MPRTICSLQIYLLQCRRLFIHCHCICKTMASILSGSEGTKSRFMLPKVVKGISKMLKNWSVKQPWASLVNTLISLHWWSWWINQGKHCSEPIKREFVQFYVSSKKGISDYLYGDINSKYIIILWYFIVSEKSLGDSVSTKSTNLFF